jgi:hypothetical protein
MVAVFWIEGVVEAEPGSLPSFCASPVLDSDKLVVVIVVVVVLRGRAGGGGRKGLPLDGE